MHLSSISLFVEKGKKASNFQYVSLPLLLSFSLLTIIVAEGIQCLLCHRLPQTHFLNCKWVWKTISERTSGITHTSRLGREFSPLIQNCHVCPQKAMPLQWNICMFVHTHACVFNIYVFFKERAEESNSSYHALKMWLCRVTWVFIPDQQSSAVWDLTELPQ